MKKILVRAVEGFFGMITFLILINILAIIIWLVMDIIYLWENPINVIIKGFTKLWKPTLDRGWDWVNIFTIILWYSFGLFITSIHIPEESKV